MAECKHGVALWSIRSRGPVCQCGAGSLELIRAYTSAREKAINSELREYRVREAGDVLYQILNRGQNVAVEDVLVALANYRDATED